MSKQADLTEYAAQNEALANFRQAQANLYNFTAHQAAAGATVETDEYLRLNQAVIDAGKALPKHLRHLRKGI
jgi:hypothetical protein